MPNPTPDCCFIPLIYNTLSATDPTASSHPHSHLPTVALSNATFGYSKLSELPQCCHGATTELLRSRHRAATDPTAFPHPHPHPHLPTVALPNATFGYSKSSELSRSGHGATTVLSRSRHGAATEPPQSGHGSHGIIPSHPHLPTLALPNATFGYSKSSELSRIHHRAATGIR